MHPALRRVLVPPYVFQRRLRIVARAHRSLVRDIARWLVRSREVSNFTYDLTDLNRRHLAAMVAAVTGIRPAQAQGYFDELVADQDGPIGAHIRGVVGRQDAVSTYFIDPVARLGRRIGWYAVARATKPRLIVETGVEHGFGSLTLCAALKRNADEGHPGRYIGVDIKPSAGELLVPPWKEFGEIVVSDAVKFLNELDRPVDLYVSDSDHSVDYEYREYQAVLPRLSANGIIIADNAHASDALIRFSEETGRQFLFFAERPKDHWYRGAGIGFSYPGR